MENAHTDLFRGLEAADIGRITALGARRHLPSGDVLFALGADANDVFLIDRGSIALTMPLRVGAGDTDVLVEERTAGQMVGWSGLIPPHRFTLTATAQADTDLLAVPRQALERLFAEHPSLGCVVARNLASIIGHRLQVVQAMWLREMQRMVELRAS